MQNYMRLMSKIVFLSVVMQSSALAVYPPYPNVLKVKQGQYQCASEKSVPSDVGIMVSAKENKMIASLMLLKAKASNFFAKKGN